jgi:RNA recognition motif-containing protein
MKILIRNLPRSLSETGLKELLEEYAEVQSCTLVLDKNSGVSKGFAFVEIPKVGDVKIAIQKLNGKTIDGNKIRVKKAEPINTTK